jgi:hypothetical protein
MCIDCHKSAHPLLSELTKMLNHPNFDEWNTTSVDHIIISASGEDGDQVRSIALELLKKFIEWKSKNDWPKVPAGGLRPFNAVIYYKSVYDELVNIDPKSFESRDDRIKFLTQLDEKYGNAKNQYTNTNTKFSKLFYITSCFGIGYIIWRLTML